MGVMPAIDVHCARLLMNISATLVGGLQIDRASDSLRSLVERSLPSGAAGPGSTSPHPPSFSQFPLFSFTICSDRYCPLKRECDFYSANSWHPPMPVLRESTASTDQRIKCQIRIFLSYIFLVWNVLIVLDWFHKLGDGLQFFHWLKHKPHYRIFFWQQLEV